MNRNKFGILMAPERPESVSQGAQWLAGQGSGSWYNLTKGENSFFFRITRHSPKGHLEFDGRFTQEGNSDFDLTFPFKFDYPSHFKKCSVIQNGVRITLVNLKLIK